MGILRFPVSRGMAMLTWLAGLAGGPAGCDTAAPNPVPQERFGRIQALIRGTPWIGDFGPDSVIGKYDPISGRVDLYGADHDRYDRIRSFRLSVCVVPARTVYPFAALNRGPYGRDALARGAYGSWWEPIHPRPPPTAAFPTRWTLVSAGGVADSIGFEALQPWYARGWFRFRAANFENTAEAEIEGRFFGRLERSDSPCPDRGESP